MKPLVAGNWKMHKTPVEAVQFVHELRGIGLDLSAVDAVICPPFVALSAVGDALIDSAIGLGAQTMHWADSGYYTGEISPLMLLACRARWVILGHSERRAFAGETDATVNCKVKAALAHGITPIVAVGDTEEEHVAGLARDRVVDQTRAAFAGIDAAHAQRCVVAYEPIWTIGTGTADDPASANAIMRAIRTATPGLTGARILYGGSVKPDNIAAFVAQEHIDGALVGSASLEAASFAALVRNARKGVTT